MMRFLLSVSVLIVGLFLPSNISSAKNEKDCLCTASETVQKYCVQENAKITKLVGLSAY